MRAVIVVMEINPGFLTNKRMFLRNSNNSS